MRAVIISCVIIILIIMTVAGSMIYMKNSTDTILQASLPLEAAIKTEDWARAEEIYNHVEGIWVRHMHRYETMYHHDEINMLQETFVRMGIGIEKQQGSEAAVELKVFRSLVWQLPEKHKFTLNNIL